MPHVIIGHTSSDSVQVWVKGDASSTRCELTLQPPPREQPATIRLHSHNDYTGTIPVRGLEPERDYAVVATFSPSGTLVRGRIRTFKKLAAADEAVSFSFILSSCNLSIVSINDFLARMAATAGAAFAASSMDIAPYRWRWPKSPLLQSVVRAVASRALRGVAGVVQSATGIKQTGSTYLRSPFLKLAAVFESCVVDLRLPQKSEQREMFLAPGDQVRTDDATGIVASVSDDEDQALRRVVIACVEGTLKQGAMLYRCVTEDRQTSLRPLRPISAVRPGRVWYDPPSFFIHAGDQIYYDFPEPRKAPDHRAYRLAYREAWFEDDALRRLLAHWPHYMTLDDHEIADQFACDFTPPLEDATADKYLEQAAIAYREYADALNPREDGLGARSRDRLWFAFDKGAAHFFVMDTRTQRSNTDRNIIDDDQMRAFLEWLSAYRNELKFVVTSVPFVAELNFKAADDRHDWYDPTRNPEQDKWTAPEFKEQRDRVIAHIYEQKIEHLVFLAGDMHCCYHATMRIGTGASRYETTVVHELAGGPVNQLQLARVTEFACHRKGRANGLEYDVTLQRFHGDVSAVMHVKVDYVANPRLHKDAVETAVPEVEWNVIRTLTDPGPQGWLADSAREGEPAEISTAEPVMGGRISFARRRDTTELLSWP